MPCRCCARPGHSGAVGSGGWAQGVSGGCQAPRRHLPGALGHWRYRDWEIASPAPSWCPGKQLEPPGGSGGSWGALRVCADAAQSIGCLLSVTAVGGTLPAGGFLPLLGSLGVHGFLFGFGSLVLRGVLLPSCSPCKTW